MTSYPQEGVERLIRVGSYYSAHLIPEGVDIRNACKVFRAKVRAFTGEVAYKIVWVRVKDGILLMCSGQPVHSHLLDAYLKGGKLYQGPSEELFMKRVSAVLQSCVNTGRRYGGSR